MLVLGLGMGIGLGLALPLSLGLPLGLALRPGLALALSLSLGHRPLFSLLFLGRGRILLKGVVSTPLEQKMAAALVRKDTTSLGVTNELEVEPEVQQ